MPKKSRVPIPKEVAAKVLFEADRSCCVCRGKRPVQIHHINDNPADNNPDNLAVLCLECHRDTQVQGGFDRKLDADQVRLYKHDWLELVRGYRADLPQAGDRSQPTTELRTTLVRLQDAMKKEDWLDVARIYSDVGDLKRRDEYIDLALAEDPSPFYQVLLRRMQGRVAELPEDVKTAAAEEVSGDWTTKGSILLDVGHVEEAAITWLDGIRDAIEKENWFLAAFYIRHSLDADLVEPLLTMHLRKAIEEDDLWWQLRCYEELGWVDEAKELLLGNETRILASDRLLLKRKLAEAKGDDDEFIKLTEAIHDLGPVAYFIVKKDEAGTSDEPA